MGKIKENILVGYEDINIFRIYFLLEKKIERIRDITFVEEDKDNIFPHASIDRVLPKENLDPIIPNETMLLKTLANFANSNYHISSLPTHQSSPFISSTSSILSKSLDEIQLEEIKQPRCSQRKRQAPNCYKSMAVNIAMSAVIFEEFQEPLTYKQALALLEAELWKQAINEEVQPLKIITHGR